MQQQASIFGLKTCPIPVFTHSVKSMYFLDTQRLENMFCTVQKLEFWPDGVWKKTTFFSFVNAASVSCFFMNVIQIFLVIEKCLLSIL